MFKLTRRQTLAAFTAMAPLATWSPDVQAATPRDALVIATEWNEFRALNLDRVKSALKRPVIIDLRNLYDPIKMKNAGFEYTGVGRGKVLQRRAAGVAS